MSVSSRLRSDALTNCHEIWKPGKNLTDVYEWKDFFICLGLQNGGFVYIFRSYGRRTRPAIHKTTSFEGLKHYFNYI